MEETSSREVSKAPSVTEYLATVHLLDIEEEPVDPGEERAPSEGWAELAELTRPELERALRSRTVLTKKQRVLVELLLEGKRPSEIARSQGVTKATISVMIRRARERLQRRLLPRVKLH